MPAVVAYPFTHRNGSHQQLRVISLSYIFYISQHWNVLEKGLFCRRFHRSEGPLQKNFLQIKVEEDLKFLLAQIMLKFQKAAWNCGSTTLDGIANVARQKSSLFFMLSLMTSLEVKFSVESDFENQIMKFRVYIYINSFFLPKWETFIFCG